MALTFITGSFPGVRRGSRERLPLLPSRLEILTFHLEAASASQCLTILASANTRAHGIRRKRERGRAVQDVRTHRPLRVRVIRKSLSDAIQRGRLCGPYGASSAVDWMQLGRSTAADLAERWSPKTVSISAASVRKSECKAVRGRNRLSRSAELWCVSAACSLIAVTSSDVCSRHICPSRCPSAVPV